MSNPRISLKITLENILWFTDKTFVRMRFMSFGTSMKYRKVFEDDKKTEDKKIAELEKIFGELFLGGQWEDSDGKVQEMSVEDFKDLIPQCIERINEKLLNLAGKEDKSGLKAKTESKRSSQGGSKASTSKKK